MRRLFLREPMEAACKAEQIPIIIRSSPANSKAPILCKLLAPHPARAPMAGKTRLLIGHLHDKFIHPPIEPLASRKKSIAPAALPRARSSPQPVSRRDLSDQS